MMMRWWNGGMMVLYGKSIIYVENDRRGRKNDKLHDFCENKSNERKTGIFMPYILYKRESDINYFMHSLRLYFSGYKIN